MTNEHNKLVHDPDPDMIKLLQEKNAIIAELKRRVVDLQGGTYYYRMRISQLENHLNVQNETLARIDRVLANMQQQAKQWKTKAKGIPDANI